MGELSLIFIGIIILAVALILLMVLSKNNKLTSASIYLSAVLGVLVSIINFTAQPSNLVLYKALAVILGVVSIAGAVVFAVAKLPKKDLIAKIMLIASLVLGVGFMFV